MPREEHNGEGFHYIVSYKILQSSRPTQKKQIWNAAQTELVIHDHTSFSQYEISVQAANNIGIVPIGQNDMKIGYSGEGSEFMISFRTMDENAIIVSYLSLSICSNFSSHIYIR